MKTLMASVFALALLGIGAANADVGAGVNVLGVGAGAHVGSHGVGAGAHVGPVGAGVGLHGHARRCSSWGYRHNARYCRHY
jgi:hypothetical protein